MRFHSTRSTEEQDLITAVMQGLAADGGLFVPDELPRFNPREIEGESLAEIATQLLAPFFADTDFAEDLGNICADALNFPVPLKRLADSPKLSVLELFHGPTAAFKDVGARFLAALMERALAAQSTADARPLTIVVATSGDTGGAVAAAFYRRRGVRVAVLYPKGQVSARQERQLTCWGENIRAFEVDGTFDDCQAMVKGVLGDRALADELRLSAANSINLGRLLPQVAYHAAGSLWHLRREGEPAGFIVPTGNLGNGLACIWARAMGMPIREIVLAVNANRTIPDYLSTGDWRPRASRQTLASAMDVGDPSNMERLQHLIPDFDDLRSTVESYPVEDEEIRAQIAKDFGAHGEAWCPHTATGFWVYDHLPGDRRGRPWVVCSTAHPAKFESIVEPVIGESVAIPETLAALLERPAQKIPLDAEIGAFRMALKAW